VTPKQTPQTPVLALPTGYDDKPLLALLRKHAKLDGALQGTIELEPRLHDEIAEMKRDADASDENTARAILVKQTQLDLVPSTIRKCEHALEDIARQIEDDREKVEAAVRGHWGQVSITLIRS